MLLIVCNSLVSLSSEHSSKNIDLPRFHRKLYFLLSFFLKLPWQYENVYLDQYKLRQIEFNSRQLLKLVSHIFIHFSTILFFRVNSSASHLLEVVVTRNAKQTLTGRGHIVMKRPLFKVFFFLTVFFNKYFTHYFSPFCQCEFPVGFFSSKQMILGVQLSHLKK